MDSRGLVGKDGGRDGMGGEEGRGGPWPGLMEGLMEREKKDTGREACGEMKG